MSTWNAYRRRVQVWVAATGTPSDKRAAQLIIRLSGTAWECTESLDLSTLAHDGGVTDLLSHLESALQVGQVHQMASSLEDFVFSLRKERAEGLNSFVTRYRNSRSRLRGLGIELPLIIMY